MDDFEKLKKAVEDIADDYLKAVGGNKAAGTRVRKVMQDVKNLAQGIRQQMLDIRATEEDPSSAPPAGA